MEKGTDTVFGISVRWRFLPEVFCRRPLKANGCVCLVLNCRHSLSALIGRDCMGETWPPSKPVSAESTQ